MRKLVELNAKMYLKKFRNIWK